ncbi:MAG TPA: hypothetical protein VN948_17380 [Terriglobales bacterium]|nr:hypothetical protein [Terriglobales bacterium]
MKRIAYVWIAGMILAGMMASFASPQSSTPQEQPLGDYARAVRKDKKPASAKQFDNDNLPAQDKLSVVGNAVAAGDEKSQTAANGGQDTGSSDKKAEDKPPAIQPGESKEDRQKTYDDWKDRLAAEKAKTDLLARELDVEQREYQLRAAAMYADAGNRMRNSSTWDKEDADYKQKIDQKKKAVEDAKKELEDMQEDARKAGVPSSVRE